MTTTDRNITNAVRNEQIFRQVIDAWASDDIDRLISYFSEDMVYIDVPFSDRPVRGHEAFRRHMVEYNSQFDTTDPLDVEFMTVVANDTHAVGELRIVAKYLGPGAQEGGVFVSWYVTLIDTIVDGKVVLERVYFDPLAIQSQLSEGA